MRSTKCIWAIIALGTQFTKLQCLPLYFDSYHYGGKRTKRVSKACGAINTSFFLSHFVSHRIAWMYVYFYLLFLHLYLSLVWWIRHALWMTCQNQHQHNLTTHHIHTNTRITNFICSFCLSHFFGHILASISRLDMCKWKHTKPLYGDVCLVRCSFATLFQWYATALTNSFHLITDLVIGTLISV